jgi:hypothetical protein
LERGAERKGRRDDHQMAGHSANIHSVESYSVHHSSAPVLGKIAAQETNNLIDQPAEALTTTIGRRTRLLKVGVVAETVNMISLGILNFAGPALLGTARYGSYARSFGVAFLALGLVDSPLALSLLVKHTGSGVLRATYRKSLASLLFAFPLGLLALESAGGLIASLCVCLAHSLGSSSISLAYRNTRPELVIGWYVAVLVMLLGPIYAGSRLAWTVPAILIVQSALLFVVGLVLLAFLVRLTARTPFVERQISTPALGIATYISGPLPWVLVLVAGALYGSVEAAWVKVGSALMSIPLASVPISGQLLLAHAHHSLRRTGAAVRGRIVFVAAAALVISIGVFVFRDLIFDILDLRRGADTKDLLPFLLAGGIGLAVFSTSWPSISSGILTQAQSRTALMLFGVASLIVIFAGFIAPAKGLLALMALYLLAGMASYATTFLRKDEL